MLHHSLSFAVTHWNFYHSLRLVGCHWLSFVTIRCHLIYHSLSFVVTRCHLLSFVVTLVVILLSILVIRCHSLPFVAPFDVIPSSRVVARCTTHLSFYKRSLFHSILTSCAKSNPPVAMGMMSNCLARYELTFRVSFYLISFEVITSQREEKLCINFYGDILKLREICSIKSKPYTIKRNCNSKCKVNWFCKFDMFPPSWKLIQIDFYKKIKSNDIHIHFVLDKKIEKNVMLKKSCRSACVLSCVLSLTWLKVTGGKCTCSLCPAISDGPVFMIWVLWPFPVFFPQ